MLESWANLISLLDNSTPTISSPLTEDFPILDLKKLPIFLENSPAGKELFDTELFLIKSGFLNLIFFKLSKNANLDFLFSVPSSSAWFKLVVSFLVSVVVVDWFVAWIFSIWLELSDCIEVCSVATLCAWTSFSFSLPETTSSNHFSKIGIASSKLGVPEDEIFCFPSW